MRALRGQIEGYDRDGPGNIYMLTVNQHPYDSNMLFGLASVNEGEAGIRTGDGTSYIAATFSCDGVHWSRFIPVVASTPNEARTYDQPVDGLLYENGQVRCPDLMLKRSPGTRDPRPSWTDSAPACASSRVRVPVCARMRAIRCPFSSTTT